MTAPVADAAAMRPPAVRGTAEPDGPVKRRAATKGGSTAKWCSSVKRRRIMKSGSTPANDARCTETSSDRTHRAPGGAETRGRREP